MPKNPHGHDQKRLQEAFIQLRLKAGLTQAELAALLREKATSGESLSKIHQTYVSKYECGERRLDLLELRDVCEACGTTLLSFVRSLEKRLAETNSEK